MVAVLGMIKRKRKQLKNQMIDWPQTKVLMRRVVELLKLLRQMYIEGSELYSPGERSEKTQEMLEHIDRVVDELDELFLKRKRL